MRPCPEIFAPTQYRRDTDVILIPEIGVSDPPPDLFFPTSGLSLLPIQTEGQTMTLNVYLSGEIHTDWREQIFAGAEGLAVSFSAPVTNHEASDDCGVAILGAEPDKFWHDNKGAKVNAIRTRRDIAAADLVVVRFGEKYRQWNAAFDAGYAAALGKSLIVLQQPDHDHAVNEVDAAALAVARDPEQVVQILRYVLTGALPA